MATSFRVCAQVEYAIEAVRRGGCVVGVRGRDVVVLAVERKAAAKLQEPRTSRKLLLLDDGLCCAFAGLHADARVLIAKAQLEGQSYRLNNDSPPTADYMARYVAQVQQGLLLGEAEFLEKNYKEDLGEEEALSLALSALTEVVEAGGRNLECAVVGKERVDFLTEEQISREV
ncbi:hypothetical protein ACSSS7_002476 [Eimeria intestinalis]